ncbi:DUF2950 domain-containing protein [Acuticoccus sediminis]|uniref:DUF2950 domain-containing protein n=1 Tax=Acuticoccus sediminis TaxID=2184697 RepID=A0A8B2NT25_9HYPH|nr:DUF2950 family protein [Acuticoccus sediminis]RAI03358.1 DUF2950 domain-containing protein [Acuticoccus sediminis]
MNRVLVTIAASILPLGAALAEPATYDSPDAAVAAVIDALNAKDRDALLKAFGPENSDVLFSDDAERDRQDWSDFLANYNTMHRIVVDGDTAVLYIGDDQWPAPIPIVKGEDGSWRLDAEAGREEIEARRIGENELDVIDLVRAYVRVQAAYRQIDYDGDGVMEFASAILSDPGERNGLYWPPEPGLPESPIGDFVARASAEGYTVDGETNEPEPYLGYYFRILDKQGPGAPGGAYDYVLGGNMVGGHALVAFPSAYGETGIMSFLVGENGVVYEADLGDETLDKASAIDAYDPTGDWLPLE